MNKQQKEAIQAQLNNEKACLDALKEAYEGALEDIQGTIADLIGRNDADLQHVIYQVQYQEAMRKQIEATLDKLQTENFTTMSQYLATCYEEGFLGTMYDLQMQGIPLIFPIEQAQIVDAVTHDTKLSTNLYTALGKDMAKLKKNISAEISRGIATGMTYTDIAKNVATYAGISKNNATRIARTEGHRISSKASMNACEKAKSKGADVVKQWDATLDGKTRPSHQMCDGEIRELDEKFSNGLEYPSDPNGGASESINCRCVLLQRARWAVKGDHEFTKAVDTDDGTQIVSFKNSKDYDSFKKSYWEAIDKAKELEKIEKRSTIYADKTIKSYISNPKKLGETTPKEKYDELVKNGVSVQPLSRGKLKGIGFEDGGGFKVTIKSDGGYLQYHPENKSHHQGAYYKISSGKTGIRRYDLNGNLIE